jgi:hypothetical protein
MNFYFNQVLRTALDGIDSRGVSQATVQLAGLILIASLLYAVYEAYQNGGDVRQLGLAGVKYLVLGLMLNNYQAIFRDINAAFDGVSDFMFNLSGVGDVGQAWMNSISNALTTQGGVESFWGLAVGGGAAILGLVLQILGFIILPITYTLFTLAYVLYGSVLYVMGPLILALIPTRALGKLGTTFAVNLMIFHSWALLYAILQVLMTAIQINDLQALANNGSFLQGFVGAHAMALMGAASLILSVCIALIPFLAKHVISGDVGSTLFAIAGTLVAAAKTAAGAFGGGAGAGAGASGATAGGSGGGAGGGAGPAVSSAGTPPVPVSGPSGSEGDQLESAVGFNRSSSTQATPTPPPRVGGQGDGDSGGDGDGDQEHLETAVGSSRSTSASQSSRGATKAPEEPVGVYE